jgi:hypothetical protein
MLRALHGDFIINGQEPAISQRGAGANMSVDVGAFKYLLAGVFGEKTTTTNVAIDASDATNPRIDLIYLATGGTITVLKGTAKAVKPTGETTWQKYEEPYPADLSGTDGIVLAEVLVPAGATSIIDAYVRNVGVTEALALYYASEARGDLIYRNATAWARLAGVEQGSIFYEGANLDPAWLAHGLYGDRLMSGGHGANPFMAGADGWIPAGETWTYASADDPTFTFTISGDLTAKYRVGMRIKLTQTSAKYFIITKVAYGSPNTTITVYGGTDYDLANATITDPYYSAERFPAGFPASPVKWTVEFLDTKERVQASPTEDQFYNLGSSLLSVPIGEWDVEYLVNVEATCGPGDLATTVTLSTSTASPPIESDIDFSVLDYMVSTQARVIPIYRRKHITRTTKISYYLLIKAKSDSATVTNLHLRGDLGATIIRAICSYL